MNPRLEMSSVHVGGMKAQGGSLKVPQETGGKAGAELRDETTRRPRCIVLNPVSKFQSFKRIIRCLFELLRHEQSVRKCTFI